MKPKTKPIRDLYFRFIVDTPYDGKLEPQDLAVLLHLEGVIDLVGHKSKPVVEHYRDNENFREWHPADQNAKVWRIMASATETKAPKVRP